VYLADTEDHNRAVIDDLKSEIANLKSTIVTLHSDYCSAQDKAKEARIALDQAKEETHLANLHLEDMRAAYDALKLR
jgi:predicted  nucleic acid-binding Zn-ribbon protein